MTSPQLKLVGVQELIIEHNSPRVGSASARTGQHDVWRHGEGGSVDDHCAEIGTALMQPSRSKFNFVVKYPIWVSVNCKVDTTNLRNCFTRSILRCVVSVTNIIYLVLKVFMLLNISSRFKLNFPHVCASCAVSGSKRPCPPVRL